MLETYLGALAWAVPVVAAAAFFAEYNSCEVSKWLDKQGNSAMASQQHLFAPAQPVNVDPIGVQFEALQVADEAEEYKQRTNMDKRDLGAKAFKDFVKDAKELQPQGKADSRRGGYSQ